MVFPAAFKSSKSSLISATPCLSRPLNGSSRIRKRGSSIMACAIPRRCRIPREYFPTGFFISGSNPTFFRIRRISAFEIILFISASISRFFTPVYWVRKPGVSMMTPRLSGKSTSRRRGCCFNRSTASTFMITSASAA